MCENKDEEIKPIESKPDEDVTIHLEDHVDEWGRSKAGRNLTFAIAVIAIAGISFAPIYIPFIFGVNMNETGVLDDVTLSKNNLIVTFSLTGWTTEYNHIFESKSDAIGYAQWLNKGIGTSIDFSYTKGGLISPGENNFNHSLLALHLKKNTTIEKVDYDQDGIWWWEKPPVRVILGDGSSFTISGSGDEKYKVYSEFFIYEGLDISIIIHYLERFDGTVEFDYIEEN